MSMKKILISESQLQLIVEHIKHKWNKVEDSRKLKHYKCDRCKSEKWWDPGFQRLMYQDRFGRDHYRAPECVLPNTKL